MLNADHMEAHEEDYVGVDILAKWIKEVPKPTITVIVIENYKRMQHAFYHIRKAFDEAGYMLQPQVSIDALFHTGSISVEAEDISEVNIPAFNTALADADVFDIYPLTNGKLRLELTFHGILQGIDGTAF